MIVPSSRLLFWVASVAMPAALLVAATPSAAPISLILVSGLGLAALTDAWMARRTLEGIDVELPAVVRMSKDRQNSLDIRIHNSQQRPRPLKIALGWPAEISPAAQELEVS